MILSGLHKLYDRSIRKVPLVELQQFYRTTAAILDVSEPVVGLVTDKFRQQTKTEENVKKKQPLVICKRSELNQYLEDEPVSPRNIKLACAAWTHRKSKGDHFVIYPQLIKEEQTKNTQEDLHFDSFADFQLNKNLVNELSTWNVEKPTLIQQKGIPEILAGHHVLLAAETGCGKTLAYLLPIMEHVGRWKASHTRENKYNHPYAIIITPTRELAVQIGENASALSKPMGVTTQVLTFRSINQIVNQPPVHEVDILIGSIGIINRLVNLSIYKTHYVRYVVLDEADALFHETFGGNVHGTLKNIDFGQTSNRTMTEIGLPNTAQIILASATIPQRLHFITDHFVNPDDLRHITTPNLHRIQILQRFLRVGPQQKTEALIKHVKISLHRKEHMIIFSNTTKTCDWISLFLGGLAIDVLRLNGEMPLGERRKVYEKFLCGRTFILSTTDAGSRGLDTTMVKRVFNYEMPKDTADYVHRCGRAGRLSNSKGCEIVSLVTSERDIRLCKIIERSARMFKPIPVFSNSVEGTDIISQDDINDYYNRLDSYVQKHDLEERVVY